MEAVKKGLVEALRVAVLAVIPVLILGLQDGVLDWRVISITGIIAVLRFVDKTLHEWGKEVGSEDLTKGLTRF